ncbi:hypothetical protein [Burkholderia territorii]|uniref:hypothetical protein n=1 Tax=Burkholderia territorii TaxID=1503055 RepID=UPI000A75C471|nr:hypothetical protein [Burkholderia territorii]
MFISALGAELPHYRNLHAGSPHYDPHYRPRYEALVGAPGSAYAGALCVATTLTGDAVSNSDVAVTESSPVQY